MMLHPNRALRQGARLSSAPLPFTCYRFVSFSASAAFASVGLTASARQ